MQTERQWQRVVQNFAPKGRLWLAAAGDTNPKFLQMLFRVIETPPQPVRTLYITHVDIIWDQLLQTLRIKTLRTLGDRSFTAIAPAF